LKLVSSWGGVGTTTLLDFLNSLPGYRANPARGFHNPLKHPLRPPPEANRAVFLYGQPSISLLSIFRRGNENLHYNHVNQLLDPAVPYLEGNLWKHTCEKFALSELRPGVWVNPQGEYADRCGAVAWLNDRKKERAQGWAQVDRLAKEAFQNFDHYLEQGVDHFRREEQLTNWLAGAPYPILLVRYEALWENLDQVLHFLEVPEKYRCRFPQKKERTTTLHPLTTGQRSLLSTLYGKLEDRIESHPPLLRI